MGLTNIEWADYSWNPWIGCTKVSPACDHCYAEGWAKRSGLVEWGGERKRTSKNNWRGPLNWNRAAKRDGRRVLVFCASLADVFDNQVPDEWRNDVWDLITDTPSLTWLLLTKRPQNIRKMLPDGWGDGWPNVWLGTTTEDQVRANQRLPHLLSMPAALHFVSYEPALGPVDFWNIMPGDEDLRTFEAFQGNDRKGVAQFDHGLSWVIAGGESGPGARPSQVEWYRSVRDQCRDSGVNFFMKQITDARGRKVPEDQWPTDLRVRQIPQ